MSVCTRRSLLFACVSLTFLLMIFPAAPELAAQRPNSQIIPVNETIPGFVSCDDFDVTAHAEGTIKLTEAGGFPTVRRRLRGSFTNEVTGFSLPFVLADNLKVIQRDEESETYIITGLQTIVTMPGEGFIVGDAGRQILKFSNICFTCPPEVIFEAGHSTADGSFAPTLCSALSQ